ncbi:MAG: HEAT repeat domain-containing protein [Sedimentisphaerales bacterium]|nr:HEAT repeat domain-containing protein [Sedimentisphaerales bacterium]
MLSGHDGRNQRIAEGCAVVDEIVRAYTPKQTQIGPSLLARLAQHTDRADQQIRKAVLDYAAGQIPKCPPLRKVLLDEGYADLNQKPSRKDSLHAGAPFGFNQTRPFGGIFGEDTPLMDDLLSGKCPEGYTVQPVYGKEAADLERRLHRRQEKEPDPPKTALQNYFCNPRPATLEAIRRSIASNKFTPAAWVKALQTYISKDDPRISPLIRELLQGNPGPSIQAVAAEGAGKLKDRECVADLLRIATSPYVAEPPRVTGYSDGHSDASGFQHTLERMVALREAAIGALGEIGDESVVEPLEAYLRRIWTERGTHHTMYYIRDYLGKISIPIEDYGHLRLVGQLATALSTLGAAQILDVLTEIRNRLGSRELDFGAMEYRSGNPPSCWAVCWDRVKEATRRLKDRRQDASSA